MLKVLVNGIKFHYWREGKGPDLIMLHGLMGNLAMWHFTLVPGMRSEYCITTYDLRGHGYSDMPPTGYTTRDMAEDLRGIMDALGIEPANLIGHSFGADITMHFSLLYPARVEKIVAIEAGIAALVYQRKREDWTGWVEWAKGLEKYGGIKAPREKWNKVDYKLRQCLKIPIILGPSRGLSRKGDKLLKLLDSTTLLKDYEDTAGGMTVEALTRIGHPVLLLYGGKSNYLGTYDVLRETLPNCTPVLLDNYNHFEAMEHPEELIKQIRPFLQGKKETVGSMEPVI